MIPNAHLKQADEHNPVGLFDNPKLVQAKLINRLAELLDERYKKFFLYGALEGKDLVFYFSHNAIAYEFIQNIQEFRTKVIPLYKELNMKETLLFTGFKAKTKHKPLEKQVATEYFLDRARGDFVIEVEDDAIKAAFTKLQNTIKQKNKEYHDQ